MTYFSQNPDVIVVGAGTAGLSAARALRNAGIDAVVLEAANHIGGRCITDTSTFSVPFDRGGSWLHSAQINPLARHAEQTGMRLHKSPWVWSGVRTKNYVLSSDELGEYRQYQDQMWTEICSLESTDQDIAISEILPEGRWRDVAQHSIAQMLAIDADVVSARDSVNYAAAEGDWLVEGGLGAFVAGMHKDVPVRCGCPVSKIDYSGARISVSTPNGTLSAKHVIVTVSTGVLAAGAIEFEPALPVEKLAAVDMLPVGLLNKIGIEFDPAWKEAVQGEMIDYCRGESEFCSLLFGFFGTGLATGFVAGRFADQLEKEGSGAATAYCLDALRSHFGANIDRVILTTSETAWRGNAHTLGSYSYAKPGGTEYRQTLAEPVDDRLFFAGEATMTDTYSTVHGAYLSGQRAANQIRNLKNDDWPTDAAKAVRV